MNFAELSALTISEGAVVKITSGDTVLWQKNTSPLPSEYQQVEWVSAASAVQAYIDLGFAFDTAATIYLEQWINGTDTQAYPFGAAENSGVLRCMLTSPNNKTHAYLYGCNGSAYIANDFSGLATGKNELVLTLKAGTLWVQNLTTGTSSTKMASQAAYTMTNHLYLFAQNYNGTARFAYERKLGRFYYYDQNDELVCDLYPCYRKSDGEIGMYDVVRQTFLTNVGSGTFTCGDDV